MRCPNFSLNLTATTPALQTILLIKQTITYSYRINSCVVLLIFKFHLSSHTTSSHFILICNEILNLNKSIRFVGLANNLGTLLATSYREGLTPLMTSEETKHYAVQAVPESCNKRRLCKQIR